jgi:hypothetical protein
MPLTCNIDARGKVARLIYGLVLLVIGVVLIFVLALPYPSVWPWLIVAFCLVSGAFAVFEASAGWCVIRAMGFKTRM